MARIIAKVKLAPGKVAYYDEYTKIHLTISNPVACIYEGMNLKQIKISVKSGSLIVIDGELTTKTVENKSNIIIPTSQEKIPEKVEKVVKIPEVVETELVSEPIIESTEQAETNNNDTPESKTIEETEPEKEITEEKKIRKTRSKR